MDITGGKVPSQLTMWMKCDIPAWLNKKNTADSDFRSVIRDQPILF